MGEPVTKRTSQLNLLDTPRDNEWNNALFVFDTNLEISTEKNWAMLVHRTIHSCVK